MSFFLSKNFYKSGLSMQKGKDFWWKTKQKDSDDNYYEDYDDD